MTHIGDSGKGVVGSLGESVILTTVYSARLFPELIHLRPGEASFYRVKIKKVKVAHLI